MKKKQEIYFLNPESSNTKRLKHVLEDPTKGSVISLQGQFFVQFYHSRWFSCTKNIGLWLIVGQCKIVWKKQMKKSFKKRKTYLQDSNLNLQNLNEPLWVFHTLLKAMNGFDRYIFPFHFELKTFLIPLVRRKGNF